MFPSLPGCLRYRTIACAISPAVRRLPAPPRTLLNLRDARIRERCTVRPPHAASPSSLSLPLPPRSAHMHYPLLQPYSTAPPLPTSPQSPSRRVGDVSTTPRIPTIPVHPLRFWDDTRFLRRSYTALPRSLVSTAPTAPRATTVCHVASCTTPRLPCVHDAPRRLNPLCRRRFLLPIPHLLNTRRNRRSTSVTINHVPPSSPFNSPSPYLHTCAISSSRAGQVYRFLSLPRPSQSTTMSVPYFHAVLLINLCRFQWISSA